MSQFVTTDDLFACKNNNETMMVGCPQLRASLRGIAASFRGLSSSGGGRRAVRPHWPQRANKRPSFIRRKSSHKTIQRLSVELYRLLVFEWQPACQ